MQNFSKFIELANNQSLINGAAASSGDFDNRVYITAENATRTVYVADLPKSITYLELTEFFENKAGPCTISIKRPMFRNFYYAFVQFQRRDHAQKILTEHRFPEFAGAVSRVLPFSKFAVSVPGGAAKHASSSNASAASKIQRDNFNLFVKGLPKAWNHEKLAQSFEQFGPVASAKVSIDFEFKSRGYGFVSFKSEVDGLKAIKAFNGLTHAQLAAKIQSKNSATADRPITEEEETKSSSSTPDESSAAEGGILTVTEYVPKLDRDGTHLIKTKKNLYVKNFPQDDFSDDQLREIFSQFGEVTSAVVMRDADSGKSKQFGFVCFQDWRDAQKALEKFTNGTFTSSANDSSVNELTNEIMSGMYVTEAKTKEERQAELAKSTYQWKRSMQYLNLIVRNVDAEVTQEEFDSLFSNFGEIRTSRLHPESQLGFVCFRDRESAQKAKLCSNLQLRGRPISANYCEPREARQKYLEEKWDKKAYERYRASQTSKTSNQDLLSLITSLGMLFNQFQPNQQQTQNQSRVPGMGGFHHNNQHQNGMGYRNNGSSRHFMTGAQQMQPNALAPTSGQQPQQMQPNMPPPAPHHPGQQPQYPATSNAPGSYQNGQQQHYRQRPFNHHNNNHHHNNNSQRNNQNPQPMPEPMPLPTPNGLQQTPQTNNSNVPPVLSPELMVAQQQYRVEIFNLFNSAQFMNANKEEHRKQMVGTAIFKHVTLLAGEELAPKITGMIIDLPLADLNYSVGSLDTLTQKVRSAVQLLLETNHVNAEQVAKMPVNQQQQSQQTQVQSFNAPAGQGTMPILPPINTQV